MPARDPISVPDLAKIEEKFSRAEKARSPWEAQWRTNLAWFVGRHYQVWDRERKRFVEPAAPPWRVRLVVNRILPIVRHIIGRFLRTKPMPEVIPATGDDADVLSAKVADRLLKYVWYKQGLEGQKILQLYTMVAIYGSAFLMPWWNHDVGDPIEYQELEGEGIPAVQRMGEINIDVVSPFEVYPDPSAKSHDEVQWIFRVKAVDVAVLRDKYPEYADRITPEPGVGPADILPVGRQQGALQEKVADMARLKEYFEAPSPKYPKGRYVAYIGSSLPVRSLDRLPYDHGEIPLIKFDYIVVPEQYWGVSPIEPLIPLNREYNRTRSMIIEIRNLMGKPKLLVPINSEVADDAFTSEPGEKIYYNPAGGAPQPWVPPPIPGYVIQELERTELDMMEVASYHWIARGMNPPGLRTAAGLALLQESDETPFGPILQWNEASFRKLAEQIIALGQQFYTEPRIEYLHLGKASEVIEFKREALKGRFRVLVDMGSSLPLSRAARIQFALELADRGAFRDERGRFDEVRFFKFLEMESAVDVFSDESLDRQVARTENIVMRDQDVLFSPDQHENFDVHEREHIQFRKALFLSNPNHPAIRRIDDHLALTRAMRMSVMERRAKEELAIQARVQEFASQIQRPTREEVGEQEGGGSYGSPGVAPASEVPPAEGGV